MATLALQAAIANTIGEAHERARKLELRVQDLERRITDAEAVLFEVTGQLDCDETRSEISSATVSTAKYCMPASSPRR